MNEIGDTFFYFLILNFGILLLSFEAAKVDILVLS